MSLSRPTRESKKVAKFGDEEEPEVEEFDDQDVEEDTSVNSGKSQVSTSNQKEHNTKKGRPPGNQAKQSGSSCHQCKSRRSYNNLSYCTSSLSKQNKGCRKKYCEHCLRKFYKEDPHKFNVSQWRCPSCRKLCCCAACRRREEKVPGESANASSSSSSASDHKNDHKHAIMNTSSGKSSSSPRFSPAMPNMAHGIDLLSTQEASQLLLQMSPATAMSNTVVSAHINYYNKKNGRITNAGALPPPMSLNAPLSEPGFTARNLASSSSGAPKSASAFLSNQPKNTAMRVLAAASSQSLRSQSDPSSSQSVSSELPPPLPRPPGSSNSPPNFIGHQPLNIPSLSSHSPLFAHLRSPSLSPLLSSLPHPYSPTLSGYSSDFDPTLSPKATQQHQFKQLYAITQRPEVRTQIKACLAQSELTDAKKVEMVAQLLRKQQEEDRVQLEKETAEFLQEREMALEVHPAVAGVKRKRVDGDEGDGMEAPANVKKVVHVSVSEEATSPIKTIANSPIVPASSPTAPGSVFDQVRQHQKEKIQAPPTDPNSN